MAVGAFAKSIIGLGDNTVTRYETLASGDRFWEITWELEYLFSIALLNAHSDEAHEDDDRGYDGYGEGPPLAARSSLILVAEPAFGCRLLLLGANRILLCKVTDTPAAQAFELSEPPRFVLLVSPPH
jgi:hypothetical protein